MNLGIKWLWKTKSSNNDVNVAKKNEANIFSQTQTITNAAEALIIKKTGAKYLTFRDANNMVGLLGFPTTNNNDIVFKNYVANGDLKLESSRNIIISPTGTNQLKVRNVDLQNTNILNVNTISANPETDIRITGERDINVSPEGGNRFISRNVDVQNTNILNVANPTATKHAANKEYVDQVVAPLNTGISSIDGTIRDLINKISSIELTLNNVAQLANILSNKVNKLERETSVKYLTSQIIPNNQSGSIILSNNIIVRGLWNSVNGQSVSYSIINNTVIWRNTTGQACKFLLEYWDTNTTSTNVTLVKEPLNKEGK